METRNTPAVEMYTHEYGDIKIGVQIDYVNKEISLMEVHNVTNKHNHPKSQVPEPKKWVFIDRGLEYMNGWRNILDGMKSAIEDAEKKLKAWIMIEDERIEKAAMELAEAIAESE